MVRGPKAYLEDAEREEASKERILRQIQESTSPEDLLPLLDPSPAAMTTSDAHAARVQVEIIRRLGAWNSPESVEALGTLLGHPDVKVATLATNELAECTAPGTERHLLQAVKDPRHWLIRVGAAAGLVRLGAETRAISQLAGLLETGRPLERASIAQWLAKSSDPQIRGVVRDARRREWNPWVRLKMPKVPQ